MSELSVSPECEAVQPDLNRYVDGELPAAEAAVVGQHLEGCASCRAEVELLRLVTQSLRLAARPEPSEAMRQRLLAQVSPELRLRKVDTLCVEQHGDRVMRRHHVSTYREPPQAPLLGPVSERVVVPVVHQFRQVLANGSTSHQVIESFHGRNYDERRA